MVVVQVCLALFLTPFYVHRLGAANFGLWVLLSTIFSYSHILEWGAMPTVARYVSHHHARNEQHEIEAVFVTASYFVGSATILAYFNRLFGSVCKGYQRYVLIGMISVPFMVMTRRYIPCRILAAAVDLVFVFALTGGAIVGIVRTSSLKALLAEAKG
ncbi:hypothetical protein ACFLSJ_09295 [Verrucomicrobiota bacterium]